MDRRTFIASTVGAILSAPIAAEAQQTGKVYRIGFLRVGSLPKNFIEGFRQGLRELGYIEGRNVTIEYGLVRSSAELPDVTAKLVQLKVDVIVASGTPSVMPAKNVADTIPVVFVAAIDPVAAGVVASLARPGGNVTGVTAMHGDLIGKRLELLKELLPKLTRIAVLCAQPVQLRPNMSRTRSLPRRPWEQSCKSWPCATPAISRVRSAPRRVRARSSSRLTPCSQPNEPRLQRSR